MKRLIVFLILLVPFLYSGHAQDASNFHFRKYQVDDGLSENSVYSIVQDHKGFMWFGTKDGLNKFDGNRFRIFHSDDSDSLSLGNNFVRSIVEYTSDIIFVGTDAGLYRMNTVTETFEPIRFGRTDGTLPIINHLAIDRNERLWIATMYDGIYVFDLITKTMRQVSVDFDMTGNPVWKIYEDRIGTIWAGTRWGLMRYESGQMQPVPEVFDNSELADREVLCIHEDINGNLWLGSWADGVRLYNKRSAAVISYLGKKGGGPYVTHVRDILQYTDKNLLIGSDDGLYLFDLEKKEGKRIDKSQLHTSLSDQNVYSIYRDNEGAIWIGTYFGGVNYLNSSSAVVETYHPDLMPGSLSGRAVSRFCEDKKGNIWLGTEDGGLNYFNVSTRKFSQPVKTAYHNIHALMLDDDDLWIGTFSRGVNVYNTKTGKLLHYDNKGPDSLDGDCVFSIYKTKAGDIYVGTTVGLNKYDRKSGSFTPVHEVRGHIYDMLEDEHGYLWVATFGKGVARRNTQSEEWIWYNDILPESHPIVNSKLSSIYMDSKKRLWFTSESRGLFYYDYEDGTFNQISMADGLPNNVIYGILDDPSGNMWISCNKGIVRFRVEEPSKYKLYDKKDWLQSNQFNFNSSFVSSDGKFYFGGINGFSCFYPQDMNKNLNTTIPNVEITEVKLLGNHSKEVGQRIREKISRKEKIVLSSNESSFTISSVSLSYFTPEKNQYAYMLEGNDSKWNYVGNNRDVTYANLPPGKYTFKVKASNNEGIWNEAGAQVEIQILPPWWWSVYAKISYLVLIALFVYALVSYYWDKNKKKQTYQLDMFKTEQEKLAYKSKIDFFTNIAHEIRTPVSLIKAPLEEVISSGEGSNATRQNLSIIEKNCDRLCVLINQLLDFRKIDSTEYILSPERINLKGYMNDLYERFKKTAVSKNIDLTLHISEGADKTIISDSDVLTKIVGNLLTNAIKFTKDKIALSLIVRPDHSYLISVEDNGRGIPNEHKSLVFDPFYQIEPDNERVGTGIGLSLVKKLAKLLHGRVSVTDGTMGGSLFTFSFLELDERQVISKQLTDKHQKKPQSKEGETLKGFGNAILVVDDNPDITSFIKNCLQNEYVVDTALNAGDAWKLLEHNSYDLIISDIMMPGVDGISFTKSVKNDLNYNHIPVILLSAKTENAVKIEGLRSGAEAFVEKPFSVPFLKAQILSLLGNRKTMLEAFNRSPLASYSMLATNKGDELFLNRLNEEIEKHLSDENFSVESLTDVLGISRSNLQRKLKAICGVSPGEYLRNYRLKKACKLLLEGELRINEVAYLVGFSSASYFTKVFIKCYDMTPKEFVRNKQ